MVVDGCKRVLGMCLLMLSAASAFGADQPNILFLLSDDQLWSGLSVAMHPDHAASRSQVIATPNVARLAARNGAYHAPATKTNDSTDSVTGRDILLEETRRLERGGWRD